MAKILRMSRFVKSRDPLWTRQYGPLSPRQADANHFVISRTPEPIIGFPEQRLSLRFSIGAEARFLLVISVVCGLLIYESEKRSAATNPSPAVAAPTKALSEPAPSLSKPTPMVSARTPGNLRSTVSKQTQGPAPSPASPSLHDSPVRYEATHKKVFGGCAGQLVLSGSSLVFHCPDQADLILPVASIAKAHKDGVVLKSGERYHFLIPNHTRDQVEAIFLSWLNRVQQPVLTSVVPSF